MIEGEIIGDYLDKIKQLENIIDEKEIVDKFQSIKKGILASNNEYLKGLIAQSA